MRWRRALSVAGTRAPLWAALAILAAAPLAAVLLGAAWPPLLGGAGAGTRLSSTLWTATRNSLLLGAGTSAITGISALGLALLMEHAPPPAAAFWEGVMFLPFLAPPYLLGLAWSALALPHTIFSRLLGPVGPPLGRLIFSLAGIAFVTATHLVPLVYVMLRSYLSGTGRRYELAALVHGVGRGQTFLTVTLPRLSVPLAGGMLLAFLAAIEEFGVPAVLGPYTGLTVLTTAVQSDLDVWPVNLTEAVRTATVLLLLGVFAWALYRRFDRSAGLDYAPPRAGPRGPTWGGIAVAAWVLVTGALPLLTIVALALLRAQTAGLHWSNVTLAHFADVLRPEERGLRALTTSVELALGAAALSLTLASGVALAQRSGRAGDHALDLLTTLLNALPGIVLAVALVLVWNAPWNPAPLYGHRGILLVAYTTVLLPLALRYAKTAAARVEPRFVAAARVHGIPGGAVARRIVLPLMLPPLLGGGVLAFAFGVREFVTSVLLQPPGVDTVSTFIFSEAQQGNGGAAMAMSVISLAVSLGAVVALRFAPPRSTAGGTPLPYADGTLT